MPYRPSPGNQIKNMERETLREIFSTNYFTFDVNGTELKKIVIVNQLNGMNRGVNDNQQKQARKRLNGANPLLFFCSIYLWLIILKFA